MGGMTKASSLRVCRDYTRGQCGQWSEGHGRNTLIYKRQDLDGHRQAGGWRPPRGRLRR